MNNIAFIADIHSNLTALNAVIADIRKKNIDNIICLGDIVGKGPRPNECVDIIRKNVNECIKGNLEVSILHLETKAHGIWNNNTITQENKVYLDNLPIEGTLYMNDKKIAYRHIFSKDDYYTEVFRPNINEDIPQIDADIVIFADLHVQYARKQGNQLVLNTGSVGNSLINKYYENKKVYAEYLILNEDLSYEFAKVDYDIEKEILVAQNSTMPHIEKYVTELRTGKYCNKF